MYPIHSAIALILLGISTCRASQQAFLPPMDNLYDNRLQIETSEYLSVDLFNVTIDPGWVGDASHYPLTTRRSSTQRHLL